MSISDENLAAYVDGELDAAARAEVEAAARSEPIIAQRIGQLRALRAQLRAAYAAELEEPVPARLLEALQRPAPPASPVFVDLQAARAAKSRPSSRAAAASARWRYSLAAGVLVAVGVGFFAWRQSRPWVQSGDGTLVAQSSLAAGLSDELSGEPASGSPLRIGLSFLAKSGNYCRTFSLADDAGLACRHAGRWEILTVTKLPSAESSDSKFRTASSPLPQKILDAVESRMAGEPLDRAGEIAARNNKWSKPLPP